MLVIYLVLYIFVSSADDSLFFTTESGSKYRAQAAATLLYDGLAIHKHKLNIFGRSISIFSGT